MKSPRLAPPFTIAIVSAVLLATLLPCRGRAAEAFGTFTQGAVAVLFFLHGAKLSRQALIAGLGHWRLHLLVFTTTYAVFPLLGLAGRPLALHLVPPDLYDGVLFLCVLPATVQSAIVFTSIAGGNLAAAICSASLSSVIGIFLTPVLVRLLLATGTSASMPPTALRDIALQLLLPMIAGQLARPWIAKLLERRSSLVKLVDQGTIVTIVYVAFSDAVVQGLWRRVPAASFAGLLVIDVVLLAIVLTFTRLAARRLGFTRKDEIAIVFCGSKKSLASGVPMANVLFPGATVGVLVLPLLVFHQIQLMVSAVIARRYAATGDPSPKPLDPNPLA